MNFSIEMLRVFCAVLDTGGFHTAAKALRRTQPGISQQIKALEAAVGQTLLDRRTARPTAEGQRLLPEIRTLLQTADSLERHARDMQAGEAAVLRVGTSDTTALYTLPEAVQRFTQGWPEVRLEIINRSTAALADLVLEGNLDVAVVTLPVDEPRLETERLFEQRLIVAVPRDHALAQKGRLSPRDLEAAPLLLLDKNTRTGARIQDWLASAAIAPQALADSASFEVLKRLGSAGVGIAILPESMVQPATDNLKIYSLRGLPKIPIGAIWRREGYRLKAAEAFVHTLRSSH